MSSKQSGNKNTKNTKSKDNSTVIIIILVICILLVIGITSISVKNRQKAENEAKSATSASQSDNSAEDYEEDEPLDEEEPEVIVFDAVVNPTYYADIEIRDYGTITVALDSDIAPISVENFVKLAKSGFYDGLTFHRIMEGFMMQGGASATVQADKIKGEFLANGVDNRLSHKRGVISMARANDPNSGSSQFFIVHKDSTFLDGNYAAFGIVTEGLDVVDRICEDSKPTDNNGTIPTAEQPVIISVTIRDAE